MNRMPKILMSEINNIILFYIFFTHPYTPYIYTQPESAYHVAKDQRIGLGVFL